MAELTDQEKIDQQLLDVSQKLLESQQALTIEEKSLIVAIKLLATAIADMPLALAATAASHVISKPTTSTPAAPSSPPPPPTTPTPTAKFGDSLAKGAYSPPKPPTGFGDALAAGAYSPPKPPTGFGDVLAAGAHTRSPPVTTNFGSLGKFAAPGTAANPLPLSPPPPKIDFTKLIPNTSPGQKAPAMPDPSGGLVGIVKKVGGSIEAVLGKLVSSFASVISPMAVMTATINSAGSGFQVLNQSVKLLGAVLAPILLPVALALAAGFVNLADKIGPIIQEVFPALARFVFSSVIPAMTLFADVVIAFVNKARAVIESLPNPFKNADPVRGKGKLADINPVTNIGLPEELRARVNKATAQILKERPELQPGFFDKGSTVLKKAYDARTLALGRDTKLKSEVEASLGYGPGERAGAPTGTASRPGGAAGVLGEVIESFRRSISPKSQTMGVSAAYSAARTAALNTDPIEARMLQAMLRAATAAETSARELSRHDTTPVYGGEGRPTG